MPEDFPSRVKAEDFRRMYVRKEKTPLLALDKPSPFRLEADPEPVAVEERADQEDIPATYIAVFHLHTKTPGNSRKHWQHEAREARRQRGAVANRLTLERRKLPPFPVNVHIIRRSAGKIDRHNMGGTMKHVIDGIADAYKVDDGDDGWDFTFAQEKAKKGVHQVEIQITSKQANKQTSKPTTIEKTIQ